MTYSFSGMSARNNSNSDGTYSDYAGSGLNNMFFGKDAYISTNNIALGGKTDFTLTFGADKYDGNNKEAQFDPAEFHVYLSNDGNKWVELSYTFAGTAAGRWNVASADFSVPAGTESLYVCVKVDVASVYRMDDMKLVVADKAGTAVDFATGTEMDFGAAKDDNGDDDGDDNTGGETEVTKPTTLTKVTIEEFKTKAVNQTDWYELTGEITEIQKEDWGNFVIEDATGSILIYGMTSKWVGSNDKSFSQLGLEVGDVVTLGTLRDEYQGTPQGGGKEIPAYYISHTSGDDAGDGGNTGDDNTGDDNTGDGDNGDDNTGDGDTGDGDNGDDNTGDGGDTNWSYTFVKEDVKDGFGEVYSAPVSVAFNGLTWKLEMMNSTYIGFDSSIGRGLQMGKAKEPATSITLSTESVTGTIKKIVVNSSGAKGTDAKLSVYVGGAAMGSQVAVTTTATDYTFEGSASGKIELKWTNSAAAAVYVKSISIEYE